MGFGKFLGVIAGGALAVVAAPLIIPAAATAGVFAAGAATAVAGAAATAGTVVASTAVGSAVVGAATTAGAAVAASTVGTAVASGATLVVGAASSAGAVVATSAVGTAVTGAAGVVVGSSTATAGIIGSGLAYSGINATEGVINLDEAKSIVKNIDSRFSNSKKKIELIQKKIVKNLEQLNLIKLGVYESAIENNIAIIRKVVIPEETKLNFADNPDLALISDYEELEEISLAIVNSKELLSIVGEGANLMQASTSATLFMMSQIGVASTGTAISSLNGAAAYNATIAALGGGSLASGGGGMALGHAVLGGVTFIPVAALTSWKFAKNSEEALTTAKAYRASVKKNIAQIESNINLIKKHITPRITEITETVKSLENFGINKIYPDLKSFERRNIEEDNKIYFEKCSKKDQDLLVNSAYYLSKMKAILSTKVFDDDGNLNNETKELMQQIHSDKRLQEV